MKGRLELTPCGGSQLAALALRHSKTKLFRNAVGSAAPLKTEFSPAYSAKEYRCEAARSHNDLYMKSSDDRLIRLIALFKLVKAGLLIALGLGAFHLLHRDMARVIEGWIEALRLDPGNRFLDAVLARASNVNPDQIKRIGVGSFIYAGLFLTEGVGLWLRKRWAEWFTVIITSSLIPVEIYEIYKHPSGVKVGVLTINIAIVAYLIHHVRRQR
jgi:uncharacterized membrane protein (DUF2068 family)